MPPDPAALHVHLNEKRPARVPKGDWASLLPSVLHIRAESQKQQRCPGHSRPAGHAAPTPRGRSCRPPVETPTLAVCVLNTVTVLRHRQQQQKTPAPLPFPPHPALLPTSSSSLGPCPREPVIPTVGGPLAHQGSSAVHLTASLQGHVPLRVPSRNFAMPTLCPWAECWGLEITIIWADLRDAEGSVPDHPNKANTEIRQVLWIFFFFLVSQCT